jgi:hypothetical protein
MDATDAMTNPIGFATLALGLSLYGWQDAAIAPLELATGANAERVKIAVVTPNGAGKSERIVASAALYWVSVHPRGRVVITSKDNKQLLNQDIPAIEKHVEKFEGYHVVKSPYFKLTTPTGGTIHAFVTDEATRAEGWHKEDDTDGPLLVIVDEAKSVTEDIFKAIYRCTWNALMLVSSPGVKLGTFFDAHTKNRADFHCVAAGLKDCPHIPQDKVADIVKTYGEEHPFTRSSVYGEFMDEDDMNKFVVPLSSLLTCLQNPPNHKRGDIVAFCDFADGGDENVIATRDGNKVDLAATWREKGKHAAVGRFIMHFRRLELSPEQIWCDASDKEMADLLAEAGWPINRKNFGSPANNSAVYISWGSEAWHEGAFSINRCEVILPDDDTLKAQMSSRFRGINDKGKLCLEDKHAMRKRNIPSPDRADAVFGALASKPMRAIPYGKASTADMIASVTDEVVTGGALAGADAGW